MWLMQSTLGAVVLIVVMGIGFALGSFSRYELPSHGTGKHHRPEAVRRIVAGRLQ
jgi:hypothetical protein